MSRAFIPPPRACWIAPLMLLVALGACATSAPSRGERDPLEMFMSADGNGDGVVSRQEFIAGRQARFDRFDRNGDGYLSSADAPGGGRRRGGGGGGRMAQALDVVDANGDGRVSRREFVEGPTLMFDRADADRNGLVDPRELDGLAAQISARRNR